MIRKNTIAILFVLIPSFGHHVTSREDYRDLMHLSDSDIAEISSMSEIADDMNRLKKLWFIEHNLINCFPESYNMERV